jgi:hypothetical protein
MPQIPPPRHRIAVRPPRPHRLCRPSTARGPPATVTTSRMATASTAAWTTSPRRRCRRLLVKRMRYPALNLIRKRLMSWLHWPAGASTIRHPTTTVMATSLTRMPKVRRMMSTRHQHRPSVPPDRPSSRCQGARRRVRLLAMSRRGDPQVCFNSYPLRF